MKTNVYQMVTDKIVEQLEKGIVPWQKPWTGAGIADGGAINYVSRRPYSMLNQMLLGREGEWLSFKQIQDCGGKIKKGAKSSIVVFYKIMKYVEKQQESMGETSEEKKEKIHLVPVLRYYNVFHIDDCTGIESKITKEEIEGKKHEPIETAEAVINDYISREKSLTFKNDQPSDKACYSPVEDLVVVPMMNQYDIVEEYYSTTFHELTHSTMKKSRCDRSGETGMDAALLSSEKYSREELVAEIGSAMLCNATGIDSDKAFKNSVAYIQGWLSHIKSDNKAIVWASSRAEKAAKYIMNINE